MFATDFSSKRLCLRALLWGGLLFKAQCGNAREGGSRSELGVLGSPVGPFGTVTVTTTIAYKPTLAPGDSTYSLLGCYSGISGGGPPFGRGGSHTIPATVPLDKLTISACLDACASLRLLHGSPDDYGIVGLRNGRECFCGSHLTPKAQKLSAEDCNTPCTGDAKVSCGGAKAVAVYGLTVADESFNAESNGNGNGQDEPNNDSGGKPPKDQSEPVAGTSLLSPPTTASALLKATGVSQPSEADADSPATFDISPGTTETTRRVFTAVSHAASVLSLSSSSTPQPDASDKLNTTATIAAVTASLSGAIILAALLFLCFRAYKRKKQEQQEGTALRPVSEKRHSRRAVPGVINTTGHHDGEDGHWQGRGERRSTTASISFAADMVPTTPALESGGRGHYPSGLHSRHKSTATSSDRDSTQVSDMRSVPATPSNPYASSAASSGVRWRGSPTTPSPRALFNFDFGINARRTSGASPGPAVPTPAPAARPEGALGERAWHRRKLSVPFQPPPSGPPSVPLPPTPPPRPRRSFDTIRFGPSPSPTPPPPPPPAPSSTPNPNSNPNSNPILQQQQQQGHVNSSSGGGDDIRGRGGPDPLAGRLLAPAAPNANTTAAGAERLADTCRVGFSIPVQVSVPIPITQRGEDKQEQKGKGTRTRRRKK
ncbi:hypothetical protein F4677DRAFT_359081 [Hypoxylon crocopeplum]|nr:hypothetical protein F4677DRAFT_359081 [Hypoxylon crocopeplum]